MMAQQMSRDRIREENSDGGTHAPEGKTITKRNFAKQSMSIERADKVWSSYREELKTREPQAVDERFAGGAFGCPGEYFRGAEVLMRGCGHDSSAVPS